MPRACNNSSAGVVLKGIEDSAVYQAFTSKLSCKEIYVSSFSASQAPRDRVGDMLIAYLGEIRSNDSPVSKFSPRKTLQRLLGGLVTVELDKYLAYT